jgi:hypothetical protein
VTREYRAIPLPAVRGLPIQGEAADGDATLLLKLYDTAVKGWERLTDVRFKLLGLLPAVSVIVWAQLLGQEVLRIGLGWIAGVAMGVAGLTITTGIWAYDRRNNELYNDLISRARRIELELGVDTGVFRGRPAPSRRLVSHGPAVLIVYATVLVGWVLVIAWFTVLGFGLIDSQSLEVRATPEPTTAAPSDGEFRLFVG